MPPLDERGVTMVELLVVILLLGVIGSVAMSTISTSLRVQHEQVSHLAALNDLKTAFERMTRDIRAADPLVSATSGQIVSRVCRPTGYVDRTYHVDAGGRLRGPANEVLASGLAYPPNSKLFTFTADNGAELNPETDPSVMNRIKFVTVRVRRPLPHNATIDLTNRVAIRNKGVNQCP
jgi:prepilin-type N-terminal cleavage/methylation domain-containing protein